MEVKNNLTQQIKKSWAAYLFLLPLFSCLLILRFKPLVDGIILSAYQANMTTRTFVGLSNFQKIFRDPIFWQVMQNTFFYVLILVPLIVAISLLAAIIVSRLRFSFRMFFRAAFYLPVVSAGVVMSLVWIWMFNSEFGLINWLLSQVGIGKIYWLAESLPARFAVCTVQLGWSVGISFIIMLSALEIIPKQFYEAAEIDGAGKFRIFFHITLPLVMPSIAFLTVINTIARFQTFSPIVLLTSGGPYYGSSSAAYRIYEVGFKFFRFGESAAYGVILLLITFPIVYVQFRYLGKKLEL